MSTIPPPYDWSKRVLEDWTSQGGLESIRLAVKKNVNFEPDPFQLEGAARILQMQDVFVISATGDEKFAMILERRIYCRTQNWRIAKAQRPSEIQKNACF
jgi:hypothetical protein